MSRKIETAEEMARRIGAAHRFPTPAALDAIRARDEQIREALEEAAKHEDWCGPYPQYAGAALALRAFAAKLGKDGP